MIKEQSTQILVCSLNKTSLFVGDMCEQLCGSNPGYSASLIKNINVEQSIQRASSELRYKHS